MAPFSQNAPRAEIRQLPRRRLVPLAVPTSVLLVGTSLSTLNPAEQALLNQPFSASLETRTIPRIVARVEKTLSVVRVTNVVAPNLLSSVGHGVKRRSGDLSPTSQTWPNGSVNPP